MTATLTTPRKCSRCQGTGSVATRVVHAGAPGGCFTCDGAGVVEGDRATIAAHKAYTANRTALGAAAFAAGHAAHSGLCLLEVNEPERCRKAVAAFAAGDARVVPALAAYFASLPA
jgi:hypothetical protein